MPIKRTAEELERPPLPRGSACHRCFSRKVRCSGQPDPGSGVFGCSSCLRTARHRGHDVSQVRCSFEKDGLCSEEGGPTLSGEILAGAGSTGPARRQRPTARSSHSSSNNSARSVVSTSSSARTDSYSTDASSIAAAPPKVTRSPQPNPGHFPVPLPSPRTNFPFPPPVPPPPSRYPSDLAPLLMPTAVPLSSQALAAVPDATQDELELPTPTANNTKTMQSLLQRRANAPARQLSLSNVSTPSSGSPYPTSSPYIDDYRQQNSAPLMLPPSWPNQMGGPGGDASLPPHQFADYPSQHPLPQYYLDGPLPNTSFALDLAPFSALTPSTLAKMNLTPTSSYDFSSVSQQPSGITQPAEFSPTGAAFTGGTPSLPLSQSVSQPGDPSFSSSLSGFASLSSSATPHHHQHQPSSHPQSQELQPSLPFAYPSNYSLPLGAPSQFYPHYQQAPERQSSVGMGGGAVGGGLPTPGFASSFHLPSPGVTFSSSIPPGLREDQHQVPRYYFDRSNGGG